MPGGTLAVAALVGVMAPWCLRVAAAAVAVRPYVDDLTAWFRGESAGGLAELALDPRDVIDPRRVAPVQIREDVPADRIDHCLDSSMRRIPSSRSDSALARMTRPWGLRDGSNTKSPSSSEHIP